MRSSKFQTTTALVASLSLILPAQFATRASAQEAQDGAVLLCLDGTEPPCPEGEPADGTPAPAADAQQPEAEAEAPEAEEPAAVEPAAEEPAAEEPAAEEPAAEEPAAEEPAAEEPAAEVQAEEPAPEAGAEAPAAPAAPEAEADVQATEAPAAEDAAPDTGANADVEADMQADVPVEADAEAGARAGEQAQTDEGAPQLCADGTNPPCADEAAPAAEAAGDNGQQEPAAEEPAAETVAEEPAAEQPAETTAEEPAAEDQPAAEAPADEPADEQPEEETAEQPAAEQPAEESAEEPAAEDQPQEEAAEDPTMDEDVPVAAAAAAAASEDGAGEEGAADDGAAAEPEVTEETLDDEDTRSSDEDFQTDVATADEAEEANDDDDDGLSTFEKALLLGLGAVAVGSLLDNGDEIVANSGDRLVTRDETGNLTVYRDDDAILRQPGANLRTETFSDGSTRTTLDREDGSQVVTIRDSRGRVLRRTAIEADGTQYALFDDLTPAEPVDVMNLRQQEPARESITASTADEEALRRALAEQVLYDPGRTFSLRQIREIPEVRELVPAIDLDTIRFATGSAAIPTDEVDSLVRVGTLMEDFLADNPREVFLIEGHTDAVGADTSNLALSDRRAESVALALTENFDIPPENIVVQGYGERYLKVVSEAAEPANRRATVRRITPLLRQVASSQ